jgi:pimeloyl-ACP methyl ester carboxylesterase
MRKPVTFVLIHGANLGGWCWDGVASILRARGFDVFTPTLGLSLNDSLASQVDAVTHLIGGHDLTEVILAGHSYGGMVITGVADRLKSRLARVVYLDAAVPQDGDDFASHVPGLTALEAEERRRFYRRLSPDGIWLSPPPLELVGISDPLVAAAVTPRLMPQALATWLEPVRLSNGGARDVPKTYVLAIDPPTEIMGYPRHAAVARGNDQWTYREIRTGHAMMLIAPEETAALLLEAAGEPHSSG